MVDRDKLFAVFKYTIYALLTLNVYLFFAEEWAAAAYRFEDGIAFVDIIEGFAASIDTAAWVILLLMFEVETVLTDDRLGRRTMRLMHALRALCYVVIVYAFYGYLSKLLFLFGAAPLPDVAQLCSLVGGDWAFTVDLDEYVPLTAANCGEFPSAATYLQLPGLSAAIDPAGLAAITRLAWVDVINSGVWLVVVFLLEVDVRLQERNRLQGLALSASTGLKYGLYSILLLAAIYWGVMGDFVDFWDAFLWLLAFFFIEMNVVEWRQDDLQEADSAVAASRTGDSYG